MKKKTIGIYGISFLWGFLEATCFFFVVDIFLSLFVIQNYKQALQLSVMAMLGAVLGGTLIYLWGASHFQVLTDFYLHMPGIQENLITNVENQINQYQQWALFWGGISGQPYKLYALYASQAEVGLVSFIAASIPARLLRFILTITLVKMAIKPLENRLSTNTLYILLSVFWIVFYTFYFYSMRAPVG